MKTFPNIQEAALALDEAKAKVHDAQQEARGIKEALIRLIVELEAFSLLDVRLSTIRGQLRRH